ncbi:MAG: LPS export ABC transporter periplasmic protein LptC [Bacteroidota bacterium]
MIRLSIIFVFGLLFLSCKKETKELADLPIYEGPILEFEGLETDRIEKEQLMARLIADKQLSFENGDQGYPEGIYLIFFETPTDTSATLIGDEAYYEKETNLYRVWGNVQVRNFEEKQKVTTEELFWTPDKKEVYTEKFVVIETEGEIIQGEGMTAKDDFSSYRILKPTGTMILEE